MDSLITAAGRALAAGNPLAALDRVALRDDPPALALRGIAMAQLGDLGRARELLRSAAGRFGPNEPVSRARCVLAETEIALVSRDLAGIDQRLAAARDVLGTHSDTANAAHAGYLEGRRLLLIGRLDDAERTLASLDPEAISPASRTGYWLVAAGIAMRRVRADTALTAIRNARTAAVATGIPALLAEVESAEAALNAPAARMTGDADGRLLDLAEVQSLFASDALVVDSCRTVVRSRNLVVVLSGRPVLFALARTLAEAWPSDVTRAALLKRAFGAREADESHRARLRVEIGRLRKELEPIARLSATEDGFQIEPVHARTVAVIAPPVEGQHAEVLALLADGEAWSSSALALALGVNARTVQRALDALSEAGKALSFGRGRACRWLMPSVPGFPTSLLLPAQISSG